MYIFSKWPFLFSSLVLLKIITAVIKCILSVVINVCNGMECILKSEENPALAQNVLPRMKTNLIENCGSNHSRSPASYSVKRNIKPASVHFLIPNLPSGKKFTVRHINRHRVVANFSNVTYDDLSNFQHKAMTVERTRPQVGLKLNNNSSGKILESSTPLDLRLKVSKCRSEQLQTNVIKIPPERSLSFQNAEQVLNSKISNASAGSYNYKQNISDRVDNAESNESNNSENRFYERISLNAPQQIVKDTLNTPSSDAVDLTQRNAHQENKITQSSEKQSFIDDERHSELITAVNNAFQCHDNPSKNYLDDSEKSDHVKKNNCQKLKQVGETRAEIKLSSPKVDAHGGNSSWNTTLDDELKVKLNSPKVGAQIGDCSWKNLDDEFIEHLDQHNLIGDFSDVETNRDGTDGGSPSPAEMWTELIKTGKPAFTDFLKETFALLEEIEMEVLKLCKVHYCKTLPSNDELRVINLKLGNLALKSIEVNTLPYHGTVIKYINVILEILSLIQIYIESHMHLNTSEVMKRSVYLKKISRAMAEERDLLFGANDDTRALQKQFQEVVKVPPRKRRNRKRK